MSFSLENHTELLCSGVCGTELHREENPAVWVQPPLFARLYCCSLRAETSADGTPLGLFIISTNLSSTGAQKFIPFALQKI